MKKHEYLEGAVEHAVHAGHEADELQRRRRNAKSESERERQRGERERGREREREKTNQRARGSFSKPCSPDLPNPSLPQSLQQSQKGINKTLLCNGLCLRLTLLFKICTPCTPKSCLEAPNMEA